MTDLWYDQRIEEIEAHNRPDPDPEEVQIAMDLLEAGINDQFFVGDALDVMWLPHEIGGNVQPVVWPMRLHKHNQDCYRA